MVGLLASAGVAMVTGDVAGYNASNAAIDSQEAAVHLEAAQSAVAFSQKTLNTIANTNQLIQIQAVKTAGRGESLSSGSFGAMSEDAYNTGQQDQANIDTESKVAALNYQSKEESLQQESNMLPYQLLGNIGQQAFSFGTAMYKR
jgi:hypothetical protein